MKKIITAVFAGAFALALAVPVASACPGHDSKVVNKEKKQDEGKVVNKDKDAPKKKDTKKKPVKVSQK